MHRRHVIDLLIAVFKYKSYLEIGVRNPDHTFNRVRCKRKLGVDIDPIDHPEVLRGTSAAFWKLNQEQWDCIFVDADHREEAVRNDAGQALRCLSKYGCLVMHDCRPLDIEAVVDRKPPTSAPWNGQAWRVFLELRARDDLTAMCVDDDHGVGLVWKIRAPGYMPLAKVEVERGRDFDYYLPRRENLLNLVKTAELRIVLREMATLVGRGRRRRISRNARG